VRSPGRGKLPACVVWMRSVFRFMLSSLHYPTLSGVPCVRSGMMAWKKVVPEDGRWLKPGYSLKPRLKRLALTWTQNLSARHGRAGRRPSPGHLD
jgi:hypothetical protein